MNSSETGKETFRRRIIDEAPQPRKSIEPLNKKIFKVPRSQVPGNDSWRIFTAGICLFLLSVAFVIHISPFRTTDSNSNASFDSSDFQQVWERLERGNRLFSSGTSYSHDVSSIETKNLKDGTALRVVFHSDPLTGQSPYAVIVGCSDSRVSPEILFNEGLGDLFVVRVAGNVIERTQLGSIEYAIQHLKSRVIYVVGHSKCGAVAATMSFIERGGAMNVSTNIQSIINKISSSVLEVQSAHYHSHERFDATIELNARKTCDEIISNSEILKEFLSQKKIEIRVGIYDVETGVVSQINYACGSRESSRWTQ